MTQGHGHTSGPTKDVPGRESQTLRVVDPQERAPAPREDDEPGEYNLRILQPAFGYIRAHFGEELLRELIQDCGLPPTAATRKSAWITHQQFEHLLAAIREQVDSDEEFVRACAYEFKKQYGPALLVMRCLSVRGLIELAARTSHMACRTGHYEVLDGTRTSLKVRYHTTVHESRLACLSRQAAGKTTPTLFTGMGAAQLTEKSCVAHGDDFCEYHLTWHEPVRLARVLLGSGLGLAAAIALPASLVHPVLAFTLLPLFGALAGSGLEMRRLLDEHVDFSSKTALETETVVRSHAEAMDALTELQLRERDWNRQVEDGVAARTEKLNAVVRRLQSALRKRKRSESEGAPVSARGGPVGGDTASASGIYAAETAVEKVSRLVGELVDIARDDPTQQPIKLSKIEVDELVVRIRRHLNATMIGREVRITVFQTREAPEAIVSVRSVLERVIDNLLFNAGRHTERGSIDVEIGGTPGSLLLKISDTGQGISKGRLEQVFSHTTGAANRERHTGLSSAARLLDQLGGRLEIMSEPSVGTTLWVYVPIEWPQDEVEARLSRVAAEESGQHAAVVDLHKTDLPVP